MYFVTERCEVTSNRQRSRPGADQSDLFAVRLKRCLRHQVFDLVLVVGRYAFQPTYRNRLFVNASATARGFARAVACAAQNAGKHIRIPVDHIRLGVLALGDQADVLRHRRMSGTRILAIHYLVEIFGVFDISWFQIG